ncbi:MAG: hypothetical protein HY706_12265 [Candidatus Hydrogenedentes bacterium]|nr:hypothetical protein [Candidatus Hydrogenedentota bacterium]
MNHKDVNRMFDVHDIHRANIIAMAQSVRMHTLLLALRVRVWQLGSRPEVFS